MQLNMEQTKVRIDKFLWAIRLFKTRSLACDACESGKVRYEGQSVKPARTVHIGDVYEIRTSEKKWLILVKSLLLNRVAYAIAIQHYEDITPPEELDRIKFEAAVFHTGKRLSKQGRPTKKNKRDLDDFMG
jgi:ribosome-associated heat shock protein Hsp15